MTSSKYAYLEADEIPTLIFGAVTHLRYAACLVIKLDAEDDQIYREWLRKLAPYLAYGRAARCKPAYVLALTASGLDKLGLHKEDLATFPSAFVNGMSAEPRARALGDVGEFAPECWKWGNKLFRADAALVVYARSVPELEAAINTIKELSDAGLMTCKRIDLQPRKRGCNREPFGFEDGVSQPVIPGTPSASKKPHPDQIVAAGEFVLGYPDNRGFMPPVPSIAAARKCSGYLPRLAGGRSDIGRNSSFLVIRQLYQDVAGFRAWIAERAVEYNTSTECIAAKMLGRWPDGSSLVRNPVKQNGERDNDYRFGVEDPDGLHCPIGAHIRRANPRDSLHPGLDDPLAITNRHRILRVGRPYVPTPNEPAAGLLFMCLNADIERQFEFIQQSWLMNPNFGGLRDEVDPIIGLSCGTGSLTIPTVQGPMQLRELKTFTKPIGGGYFWLPSRTAINFLSGEVMNYSKDHLDPEEEKLRFSK